MAETGLIVAPAINVFYAEQDYDSFVRGALENGFQIFNTIEAQLIELLKSRNPSKRLLPEDLKGLLAIHLDGKNLDLYGVWVEYPWSKKVVHLLPENEFVEVRTNRNQYKITPQEQNQLSTKKVGIIGLSVGQSVALTMAMERSFGELRIADFDTLDLSNLNRLRGNVFQLGLPKTQICAHEILELDPFLKVITYNEGIHESNIDTFFTDGGNLDLLVEECDGLDIKILARHKARQYQVPVIMETSDRGLLDIERFDREPNRALLHGLIGDLDPSKLKGLSMEDKVEFLLPMVGLNALSERMKASMIEVQSSITSWPQLASAVTMGGGVTAEMSRKILLNQSTISGRYYIDLDELVPEPKIENKETNTYQLAQALKVSEIKEMLKNTSILEKVLPLSKEEELIIAKAAVMAPSGGNVQPWRILFHKGNLILVHDIYHSQAFLDYAHLGSYLAFGTMVENIRIQSLALGYKINCQYFPEPKDTRIVASIWFEPNPTKIVDGRVNAIYDRLTNRRIGNREPLPIAVKEGISRITQAEKLAKLTLVEDLDKMNALADILSTAEKLLLLHPQGHHDIFHKELRFSKEEALATADGLDIATLNMSKAEILALRIASSRKAIDWVDKIGGGEAFKKNTKKAIAASSALGVITMPFFSNEAYLHGGEFLEKIWIETTLGKCSFQPVTQYSYLLARLNHGNGIGYDEGYKEKIRALSNRFNEILHEVSEREVIFIFRLALENEPEVRSIRRSVDKIFIE